MNVYLQTKPIIVFDRQCKPHAIARISHKHSNYDLGIIWQSYFFLNFSLKSLRTFLPSWTRFCCTILYWRLDDDLIYFILILLLKWMFFALKKWRKVMRSHDTFKACLHFVAKRFNSLSSIKAITSDYCDNFGFKALLRNFLKKKKNGDVFCLGNTHLQSIILIMINNHIIIIEFKKNCFFG